MVVEPWSGESSSTMESTVAGLDPEYMELG